MLPTTGKSPNARYHVFICVWISVRSPRAWSARAWSSTNWRWRGEEEDMACNLSALDRLQNNGSQSVVSQTKSQVCTMVHGAPSSKPTVVVRGRRPAASGPTDRDTRTCAMTWTQRRSNGVKGCDCHGNGQVSCYCSNSVPWCYLASRKLI